MSRCRNYCFTLNNYTEDDESFIKAGASSYDYVIYGREKGKEGTPHLQGYIELPKAVGIKAVKKLIEDTGLRAHIEPRKGTQQQAISYCMKEKDYVEIGSRKQQGKRNDLKQVRQMVQYGAPMRAVIMETDNYQAIKYAEKVMTYFERKRSWNPNIIWIYGQSGYGKSHIAHSLYNDAYSLNISKWWQSYDAHETVIIDNFTEEFAPLSTMLRMLDKYPYMIEYKGGSRQLLARNYIITSVRPPHEHYRGDRQVPELMRRLQEYGVTYHLKDHHKDRDDTDFLQSIYSRFPSNIEEYYTSDSNSDVAGPA